MLSGVPCPGRSAIYDPPSNDSASCIGGTRPEEADGQGAWDWIDPEPLDAPM